MFDQPGAIDVPMVSLDGWAKDVAIARIDFLKIDVEGYERNVLRGGRRIIEEFKPVTLIEFNSLTTIMVARILPYHLLDWILAVFPFVDVVDVYTGVPKRLERSPTALNAFVGDNMTGGFVHDLLCYFEDGEIKVPPSG